MLELVIIRLWVLRSRVQDKFTFDVTGVVFNIHPLRFRSKTSCHGLTFCVRFFLFPVVTFFGGLWDSIYNIDEVDELHKELLALRAERQRNEKVG